MLWVEHWGLFAILGKKPLESPLVESTDFPPNLWILAPAGTAARCSERKYNPTVSTVSTLASRDTNHDAPHLLQPVLPECKHLCVCKCMQMYLRGLNQQCHPNSTPHQKNHQIHPGDSVTRSKGVTKTASQPWSSTCGGQRQPCRTDLRPKGGVNRS